MKTNIEIATMYFFFIFQQFRIVTTPWKMDYLVFERGWGDFEKYYPASIFVPKKYPAYEQ